MGGKNIPMNDLVPLTFLPDDDGDNDDDDDDDDDNDDDHDDDDHHVLKCLLP